MKTVSVIIVAGGSGTRMGSDIPKQFLLLDDVPVLMHTISAFHNHIPLADVVVVLPFSQIGFWGELCKEYRFEIPHNVVAGGETRFHSVKNGLAAVVPTAEIIMVHDGVRPLVAPELIDRLLETVARCPAIVPVVDCVDSMREVSAEGSKGVDRSCYKRVQTPQVFAAGVLRSAYEQPFCESFTDDASVVETLGVPITLVNGDPSNIKITIKADLWFACAIKKAEK